MTELGEQYPQPDEDIVGESVFIPRLHAGDRPIIGDGWQPSESQPLPPRVSKVEMPKFHAAVRIGLREHYVRRGFSLDFGHGDVTELADSILAHWSMAITSAGES